MSEDKSNHDIERRLAINLVTSFVVMLQECAWVMSTPTWCNFQLLLPGWIFAGKRTVTGMIVAAGLAGKRHHSIFHRLFAAAKWSLEELGLAIFGMMQPWLGETVFLAIDDTLAHKRGTKVFGAGMHHDPQISSRGKAVTRWGHSWVVLGVVIRFPLWPDRPFCLPILFRLYLNKKEAQRRRRTYRTRPELAVAMLKVLCRRFRQRRFHAVADAAYGGQSVLKYLPNNCDLTSRLRLDAHLVDTPPARKSGRGRPRIRGERLPSPMQMLAARASRVTLKLYGRQQHARWCDQVARVFAVPGRPLRVVAVEALAGGRGREAFYSTDVNAKAIEILTWYAMRWSIEVTFHDCKQHLGFEEPQGWTRQAVQRTAPVAMLLYSLILIWYIQEGHRHDRSDERPWYRHKTHASFADMLVTLRRASIREHFFSLGLSGPGSRKTLNALENAVSLAS